MKPADTTIGGGFRDFPETTWSLLTRLRDPDHPDHREGLEALCRRHWKPVYYYVRLAWTKTNEESKDLAQAFFLWLIEGDALRRLEPGRGGFRRYLKFLLRRFVAEQERHLHRLKRGGGVRIVPLDGVDLPDPEATDPEAMFDRVWVTDLVNRAVDRVRTSDPEIFRVYEQYYLVPPGDRPTYETLAERLGIKVGAVQTRLVATRKEIRRSIRSELAELTIDREELEEEWKTLFDL